MNTRSDISSMRVSIVIPVFNAEGSLPELHRQLMPAMEALVERFVGALTPDLRAAQRQRVIEQDLALFRFAWAGALSPGEGHYFRVHGPVTLIEHDNTQNDANHIHSVWRDLAADFGHDALADHYKRDPHR